MIRSPILAAPLALVLLSLPLAAAAQTAGHGHHHPTPAAPGGTSATATAPYAGQWAEDMARMHADMDIRLSGQADLDFLLGMIPHHRGAIAMAELALRHARDPQVRALAQNILWDQQREIQDMEGLVVSRHLGNWPGAAQAAAKPAMMLHGGDQHHHAAMDHVAMDHASMDHGAMDQASMGHGPGVPYAAAWATVMADMHAGMDVPLTGNADIDFLRGMIPHHAGALDMARLDLAYGRDVFVQDLAREIIIAQQAEIAAMQAILARLGG